MADQISFRDLYDDSGLYLDSDNIVQPGGGSPIMSDAPYTPAPAPLVPYETPKDIINIGGGPRYKAPQMENPFITQGDTLQGTTKHVTEHGVAMKGLKGKRHYIKYSDPKDWNVDTFNYQGMNPDVMGALSNIMGQGNLGNYLNFLAGGSHHSEFNRGGWANQWESVDRNAEILARWKDPVYTGEWTDLDGDGQYDAGEEWNRWEGRNIFGGDFAHADLGMDALNLVNIFDPESIANMIAMQHGGSVGDVRAGSVQALTPEMLQKTQASYYDPLENIGREKLTGKLTDAVTKANLATQKQGFAGSGMRDVEMSEADKLYRAGYGDLISQIEKLRADALDDVMERIYSWDELGSASVEG